MREFRLLFAGHGVSVLGDRMVAVALAFAVLELGGSASEVGLVLAASWVPAVASVLVGGVVADRISRRTVMVARGRSCGSAARARWRRCSSRGAAEIWMLAALAGVTGAATGFFNPAATGLLPDVVPAEGLQPANALRSTAASVSEILGPLAAGILVAAAGAGLGDRRRRRDVRDQRGVPCGSSPREGARAASRPSFLSDLRDGWIAVRSRRWLWTFIVYVAVGERDVGRVDGSRPGGRGPGTSAARAAWGTVLGAVGVGALLGSLVATRVEAERGRSSSWH